MSELEKTPVILPEESPSNGASSKVLLIICVLLLIVCSVLTWQLLQQKSNIEYITVEKDNLSSQAAELTDELEQMQYVYDSLETSHAIMSEEMVAQQLQIEDMLVQIKKHKNDAYLISRYKKEAGSLRSIMKNYLRQIDSLNTLNIALQGDLKDKSTQLAQTQTEKANLEEDKKNLQGKVAEGSVLIITNISSVAIKVRRTNQNQVPTQRASSAEMIKSCFTITRNSIAEPGNKNLYMRITAPNGSILNDGSVKTFTENGSNGQYSVVRQINYQNKETNVCLFYEFISEVEKGNYKVQIFESGKEIGSSSLTLK